MDLSDVRIAVQWRATCDMCDLWQRFGRVARESGKEGTGLLFYEKAHLDDYCERKKTNAQTKKRKALEVGGQPAKRLAKDSATSTSDALTATSSSNRATPSDVAECWPQ